MSFDHPPAVASFKGVQKWLSFLRQKNENSFQIFVVLPKVYAVQDHFIERGEGSADSGIVHL